MKRHSMDPVSLVFGLFFASLGVLHLAGALDASMFRLRWLVAVALIVLGAALTLGRSRDGEEELPTHRGT